MSKVQARPLKSNFQTRSKNCSSVKMSLLWMSPNASFVTKFRSIKIMVLPRPRWSPIDNHLLKVCLNRAVSKVKSAYRKSISPTTLYSAIGTWSPMWQMQFRQRKNAKNNRITMRYQKAAVQCSLFFQWLNSLNLPKALKFQSSKWWNSPSCRHDLNK